MVYVAQYLNIWDERQLCVLVPTCGSLRIARIKARKLFNFKDKNAKRSKIYSRYRRHDSIE